MTTLIQALSPRFASTHALARNVLLALIGAALLTISAKLKIPFWPVPMTMQTYVVLVLGMAYGWRLGAATMLTYLALGAVGLPVFAGTPEKGIGLPYMLGPTGGYLAGFVAGAALCGWLAERGFDRSFLRTLLAMILGLVLIYAFGLTWLATQIGWSKAITFGLAPFWTADLLKIVLGALTLPTAWKLLGHKAS